LVVQKCRRAATEPGEVVVVGRLPPLRGERGVVVAPAAASAAAAAAAAEVRVVRWPPPLEGRRGGG
jgi:hypothetical protein